MVTCPYCKQRAMTAWGKLSLGPARSVKCASCGRRVSVSWWAFAIFIATFAPFWALSRQSMVWVVVGAAVIFPLFFAAHYYLVSLVGREK
jgi:hypothetical protein